jgi:hypothetical protein
MGEHLVTDASLRQFLLGRLDEEERQQIETLFITGSLSRERILLVEQDLIEDYLEGSLTATDQKSFLAQYTVTPTQRRKLRIARSIRERAAKEGAQTVPATVSVWRRLGEWLRPRFVFVAPIAATLIIAIVAAAIWLNGKIERRNRQLAIAEEVIRLNAPASMRDVPPGKLSSLELRPGSHRSVEAPPELVKTASLEIVELQLLWIQEQYPSYRAVVQRVGDYEPIPVNDRHAESDGKTILVRLPVHILTRGTYRVELTGIAADGTNSPPEEYQFTVRG